MSRPIEALRRPVRSDRKKPAPVGLDVTTAQARAELGLSTRAAA